MSMLDLSKVRYSSYFQGLGNVEPLPQYEFEIPQINATRSGSSAATYRWNIPSSSTIFSIPLDRIDVLSSVLFSIRDVNTNLNIVSGTPWHSWATSIASDVSAPSEYINRFESLRGTCEFAVHDITTIPVHTFDYMRLNYLSIYEAAAFPDAARVVIRTWIDSGSFIFQFNVIGGSISREANGYNNPTNKAVAPAILRIKLKQYIAPWNL